MTFRASRSRTQIGIPPDPQSHKFGCNQPAQMKQFAMQRSAHPPPQPVFVDYFYLECMHMFCMPTYMHACKKVCMEIHLHTRIHTYMHAYTYDVYARCK